MVSSSAVLQLRRSEDTGYNNTLVSSLQTPPTSRIRAQGAALEALRFTVPNRPTSTGSDAKMLGNRQEH